VAASSDDDGETWTKPRLVIDPPDHPTGVRRRTLVGNFWTDPQGRLWLFFDQSMFYFDGRAGDWYIRSDNPDADTPVWTRPQRIWHGCTLQKPTVLTSGEWLLPISLWNFRGRFPELDAERRAWLFVSPDAGASWQKLGSALFPHFSFDEHMLIERRDGQLWMTARTAKGIYESVSADRGKTWSEPTPAAIVNTASRHFIRRLQSGRILLVKNGPLDQDVGRRQLMALLSEDDGRTWRGGLELESRDRDCSYPDGFQAADGRVFIVYDHERTGAKQILLARCTEADILAGRLVTPGSRLRLLVNQATGAPE
jgi:predicted neuraminidase